MSQGFFIVLAHQGNEYNVEIEEPNSPISDLIKRLVNGLGLPRVDGGGNPASYFLGRVKNDEEEILQARMHGEEMTLFDYDVQSGDRLTLTVIPIAG